MSSEFLNIPIADDKNGLSGVFMVPQIKAGTYFGNIPGMELFPRDMRDSVLIEPDRYFENFVQRPIQDEYLQPWTETELKQLGISVQSNLPKAKPEEQSTPKQALPIVRTVHTSTDEQPKRQIKTNLRWLPDTDTENGLTRI